LSKKKKEPIALDPSLFFQSVMSIWIELAIIASLRGEKQVTEYGETMPLHSQQFLYSERVIFELWVRGKVEYDIVFDYWGDSALARSKDVIEYHIDEKNAVFVTEERIFVCTWDHSRALY
jgi:hypothetical protein